MTDTPVKKAFSSFFYLNVASFLGCLNDNLYKYLLIYSLLDLEGFGSGPAILSLCGGIFVLPYILFSLSAGILADRFSKRNIIVITKAIEIVTVFILLISFLLQSPILGYAGLFLLGAEEAFSSPSQYGIIPELVEKKEITTANGYMTSFAYFGVMLGAALSSILVQITNHNYKLASISLSVIAILGFISAWQIPVTPSAGGSKKLNFFFIRDVITTLKEAKHTDYLLACMLGIAYFLLVASFSQANIIPYSVYNLGLTDVESGYFVFSTTIGVCIGSIIAGKISGPRVALGLIPLGILGIAICFHLFLYTVGMILLSLVNTLSIGIFAGLYLVPQNSYIQAASRSDLRGQNIAVSNFLGWCAVFIASFIYYYLRHIVGLSPTQNFGVLSLASIIITPIAFRESFYDNSIKQDKWNAFLRDISHEAIPLKTVMLDLQNFFENLIPMEHLRA